MCFAIMEMVAPLEHRLGSIACTLLGREVGMYIPGRSHHWRAVVRALSLHDGHEEMKI